MFWTLNTLYPKIAWLVEFMLKDASIRGLTDVDCDLSKWMLVISFHNKQLFNLPGIVYTTALDSTHSFYFIAIDWAVIESV